MGVEEVLQALSDDEKKRGISLIRQRTQIRYSYLLEPLECCVDLSRDAICRLHLHL